jgi:hypothetical protein
MTLEFGRPSGRRSMQETFFPWDITAQRFLREGLKTDPYPAKESGPREAFLGNVWANDVMRFEQGLGFDPVLRLGLYLPALQGMRTVLGKGCVETVGDFDRLLEYSAAMEQQYLRAEDLESVYGPYRAGHERGDFSVRVNIMGFFFSPRELTGIENHLYAFYDMPELLHRISEHILKFYLTHLTKLLAILPADVLYLSEDLSGKNGPMISPAHFEQFIGDYYRKLFPVLRKAGVRYIFVDTDGDFTALIGNFIAAGVDGFLPMDVNAGMDIVAVRRDYPKLRFIGGYNKLVVAQGSEAIDAEFRRIMPVVEQGGYIVGCDHQLPPETPLENYQYYIKRLADICGTV